MLIYSLSVFLDEDNLKKTLARLDGEGISYRTSVQQDQTGESATVHCCQICGLRFVFTSCNDFHKNQDFEIGLTLPSLEEAGEFFEGLDPSKYEIGVFGEDSYMYGIPLDDSIHGPFFFCYDRNINSSTEKLRHIKARIWQNSLDFYEKEIKPLIGEELAGKLIFTSDDSFSLDDISFDQ